MKNLIKGSFLGIIMLMASLSFAKNNDPSIEIKLIETKLIQLSMFGSIKMVEVSVKDKYGSIIYNEKSKNLNISKKYDLNNLPRGEYFMEIESLTRIKVIPFEVDSKSIKLNEMEQVTYYKPMVRKRGGKLFISKLNLNNENLEIILYDTNSNIIYNEKLAGNSILERKLNLKNLESGNYNLILRSGGKSYYENIEL